MFLIRLVFSPIRIVLFFARIFGYSRLFFFVVGVAVGLLLAPTTGAELRAKLRERMDAAAGTGAELTAG
jgi:hypothetical protein